MYFNIIIDSYSCDLFPVTFVLNRTYAQHPYFLPAIAQKYPYFYCTYMISAKVYAQIYLYLNSRL